MAHTDRVILNSGGPIMEVVAITGPDPSHATARCRWKSESGDDQEQDFPVASLSFLSPFVHRVKDITNRQRQAEAQTRANAGAEDYRKFRETHDEWGEPLPAPQLPEIR